MNLSWTSMLRTLSLTHGTPIISWTYGSMKVSWAFVNEIGNVPSRSTSSLVNLSACQRVACTPVCTLEHALRT